MAHSETMTERSERRGSGAPSTTAARSPWKVRRHGWKQVFARVRGELQDDHLSLLSAGVAFFGFLSIFPALAAVFALYGLFLDPAQAEQQLAGFTSVMPASAADLVQRQMQRLVSASPDGLGVGALVGIVVALWSANKGTKGLVKAIKVAHDTEEHRGFVRLNVVTLGFTLASIVIVGVILAIVAGIPALLGIVGIDQVARTVIDALRWPLLAIVLLFAIGALYRWGGSRRQQPWVTPGSVLATVALLIASALFSFYVSRFDSFVTTYGSLAAVAIMMLWLFIGAYAVLLGAEIDAEVSRQVRATGSSQAEARKTA